MDEKMLAQAKIWAAQDTGPLVQRAHSSLGASSAERWSNCPGSNALINLLGLENTESEFAKEGSVAHEFAARLLNNGEDAWELIGQTHDGVECNQEMADAIQLYKDTILYARDGFYEKQKPCDVDFLVEYRISLPEVHEAFYGTLDNAILTKDEIQITDFKYGAGIAVDVEENPQLLYYAYGLIATHDSGWNRKVVLRIVQPRAFHIDGPVREWETTEDWITNWARTKLLPAMEAAETEQHLVAGEHCRFCPAKQAVACPLLKCLYKQFNELGDPKVISDDDLGRDYGLIAPVKMHIKALEEAAYSRLVAGSAIEGVKLVHKKANRVFKPGAIEVFRPLGDEAFTKPELKSPAEMEKLGPKVKDLVKEYAYMPVGGLTVAPTSDKRGAVKAQSSQERFAGALDSLPAETA